MHNINISFYSSWSRLGSPSQIGIFLCSATSSCEASPPPAYNTPCDCVPGCCLDLLESRTLLFLNHLSVQKWLISRYVKRGQFRISSWIRNLPMTIPPEHGAHPNLFAPTWRFPAHFQVSGVNIRYHMVGTENRARFSGKMVSNLEISITWHVIFKNQTRFDLKRSTRRFSVFLEPYRVA